MSTLGLAVWARSVCLVPVVWISTAAISAAVTINMGTFDIEVKQVTKRIVGASHNIILGIPPDKESFVYLIEYQYEFHDLRTNVYINGLGKVPAKGSFAYLSRELELPFVDADTGKIIATVPLRPTDSIATGVNLGGNLTPGHQFASVELPSVTQFPAAFRAYIWESQASLQAQANAVLAKRGFFYQPYDYNGVTYFPTTAARFPVDKLQDGAFAAVALLISFPYDRSTEKYWFHIQSLVLEDRTHSQDPRLTNNPFIKEAAGNYIDKLVAEMRTETRPKP